MSTGATGIQEGFVFNGINGTTGQYLLPRLLAAEVASLARGERLDVAHLRELQSRHRAATEAHYGVGVGIDPFDLASAGWAVIFADDVDPAIGEALQPLLDHRQRQAGDLYKRFDGPSGHRLNESKDRFLARNGIGPGTVVPAKVPYYVLVVGDPERIPFRFQYQLDVSYAVGRLCFDTPEQYARYAHDLVAAETTPLSLAGPRRAVFFGVRNEDDPPTQLSADQLVAPLAGEIAESGWQIETLVGDVATKSRLKQLLGGPLTPSLLFTASHGMGFSADDARLVEHQGALLCQDWPGPVEHRGPIPQDFYLAGDEISSEATLAGLISFHFACYSAGTPRLDDFAHNTGAAPEELAQSAFVAGLPGKLLSHPRGAALATIGHVERAWGSSFMWDDAGPQREAFRNTILTILQGKPIGAAMEFFNLRYADIAAQLSSELEDVKFGKVVEDVYLAQLWTATNDARNMVLLGDPAVRLQAA